MLISVIRACVAGAILAATVSTAMAVSVPAADGQYGVPYQRELSKSCFGSSCSLDFPVIPTKRRLDLSLVNCAAQGVGSLTSIAVFLLEGDDYLITHELIQAQTIVSGQTRRLFSEPVEISAGAGRRIRITVLLSNGAAGLRCSIFGTLVVLP